MQIYTLLYPSKSIPYYPHGMITPPFPVRPIFTTYILKLVFYFFSVNCSRSVYCRSDIFIVVGYEFLRYQSSAGVE